MESAYFTNYKSLEKVYDSLLDAFISYLKDKVTPSCYDNFKDTIFKTSITAKDRCYEEFFIDGVFKNFDWLPIYNAKQAEAIKEEIKKLNDNIEFLRTIKHSEENFGLNGLSVGQRDGNTVKLIRFGEVYNHTVFTFTDAITAMSLQYLDDNEKKYNALCREVIEQITQIKTHLHCLEADADLHKKKVKKYRKKVYRKRFGSFWDNIDSDDVMLFVANFISIVVILGFFGLAGFAIIKAGAGDIVEQPDTAITETVEMDNAYNIENMAENEDDAEQYNTEQDIEQNIQDDEQNSVIDEEQNEVEQEYKTIEQVALLAFCLILFVFIVLPVILL